MEYSVNKKENLVKFIIHTSRGVSFGGAQKLLRNGDIKVNGKRCKQNISLEIGDKVEIYEGKKLMPKVEILYSDENILIVNKPAGIECATRDKSSPNTYSLEEILEEYNAIIIHRLDRLTEGLVILARNVDTARAFEIFFRSRKIEKHYLALLEGMPKVSGVQTAYLKKDASKALVSIKDSKTDGYKEIITEFYIQNPSSKRALVDITLHTGRTHQIRGYFSHIGTPVVGDSKYGSGVTLCDYKGYCLTAYKLNFNLDGKYQYLNSMTFEITPSWRKLLED